MIMRSLVASWVRLPAAAVQLETLSANVPFVIAAPTSAALMIAWSFKNRMVPVDSSRTYDWMLLKTKGSNQERTEFDLQFEMNRVPGR